MGRKVADDTTNTELLEAIRRQNEVLEGLGQRQASGFSRETTVQVGVVFVIIGAVVAVLMAFSDVTSELKVLQASVQRLETLASEPRVSPANLDSMIDRHERRLDALDERLRKLEAP